MESITSDGVVRTISKEGRSKPLSHDSDGCVHIITECHITPDIHGCILIECIIWSDSQCNVVDGNCKINNTELYQI